MKRRIVVIFLASLFSLFFSAQKVEAALADGTYSIDYTVIQSDSNSASMANDYFNKPASVTVSNGSYQIQLTLNHSSWITDFSAGNGVSTVASDSGADTRTVSFTTSSISSPVTSSIAVDIEEDSISYHHTYTIRLQFDESNATLVSGGESTSTSSDSTSTSSSTSSSSTSTVTNAKTGDNNYLLHYSLAAVVAICALVVVYRIKGAMTK